MKKNTEISERILQIIEFVKSNPNEFAKKLGYNRGQTIYDVLNKKAKPSYDFFYRLFSSEYSEIINLSWVITGDGEMLKDANAIPKCSEPPIHYNVEVDYKNKYLEVLEELTTLSRETIKLQSKIISLQDGLILNNKKRQNNHDAVHEM